MEIVIDNIQQGHWLYPTFHKYLDNVQKNALLAQLTEFRHKIYKTGIIIRISCFY